MLSETVTQRCSLKKVFLKISQNSQENTYARVSFLIKKGIWNRCFPVKFAKFLRTSSVGTLAQVFSYEFFEIFKNTFFIEQLRWLLLILPELPLPPMEDCKFFLGITFNLSYVSITHVMSYKKAATVGVL